jgi:hypothetical protein
MAGSGVALAALACFLVMSPLDATAQIEFEGEPDGEDDCRASETVEGCVQDSKGEWECEPYALCENDETSASSTAQGGMEIERSWCLHILGTQDPDTIYIGSVWIWNYTWQVWYTLGELGYCKNDQLVWCSETSNPIVVKPYDGNDTVRVPRGSALYSCGSYKIGKWEVLDEEFSSIGLKVYACGGTDYVYGTPNADTLIGGSGADRIYGYGGADKICGGYGDFSGHECEFCNSGSNCTPSGGYDTGNDLGDTLRGEGGGDVMCGVDGADGLYGDYPDAVGGSDHLYGMGGCDYLTGDKGNDVMYAALGTSGSDLTDLCSGGYNALVGGDGDDTMHGSNSPDRIWGEVNYAYTAYEFDGRDEIRGYGGDDKLCPGGALFGYDKVWGGGGADLIVYYLSDYDYSPCMDHGYECTGERAAKGEDGDDDLWYRGMDCRYYAGGQRIPCPDAEHSDCFGGILLEGDNGTDCCQCEGGAGICSTEDPPSCDYTSSLQCGTFPTDFKWGDFYCPFPYFLDDPGWTCY